ncbi:uncharacterized protein LOC144634785 [Oculina patagonica]
MMEVNFASKDLSFTLLRHHPEFLEETANLLNSQWKKSLTGRLQYLEEGQDNLPCSLILLQKDQGQTRVIGHSRLNQVLEKTNAVFVTCVIVEKTQRGCGLGKKLMQLTENYASQLGCTAIYLSTFDKYEFYKHLGYQCCSQVTQMKATRGSLFTVSQLALLREQFGERESQEESLEDQEKAKHADCSPKNCVINQKLPDDTRNPKTSFHKQGINAGQNEPEQQEKICQDSLSPQEAVTSTLRPPPPSLPPPHPAPAPPPPPPALKLPTSRVRSILSKPIWMMKEM